MPKPMPTHMPPLPARGEAVLEQLWASVCCVGVGGRGLSLAWVGATGVRAILGKGGEDGKRGGGALAASRCSVRRTGRRGREYGVAGERQGCGRPRPSLMLAINYFTHKFCLPPPSPTYPFLSSPSQGQPPPPSRLSSPIHYSHTDALHPQPKPSSLAFLTTTTSDDELSAFLQAIDRRVMLRERRRGLREGEGSGGEEGWVSGTLRLSLRRGDGKGKGRRKRRGGSGATTQWWRSGGLGRGATPVLRLSRARRLLACYIGTPDHVLILILAPPFSSPHPLPHAPPSDAHTPAAAASGPRIPPAGAPPPTVTFHAQVDA
ncbi:hypothetical protein JB92DRAFT_3097254 [Gautieria morchelliformis]|nr:hypothetical protein JB92DRAFT_3097254 [Gautieria morchelliformis]